MRRNDDSPEEVCRVQIVCLDPDIPLLRPAHTGDAGADLRSAESAELQPLERRLIRTGISVAVPQGFAGYIQPRSGMALRRGLGILNSPGLIDAGYRGELKVIAINLGREAIEITRGERIAQLVILPVPQVVFEQVDELPPSDRGEGGFGSTGLS